MSYVPVSSEHHFNKRWKRPDSYYFAETDNVVPIYLNEITSLVHSLPLAFIKNNSDFVLVAVSGLRPNENLLVSKTGQWLAEYIPAVYRFKPFQLFDIDGSDKKILGIEESHLIDDGEDLIFDESGKISADINNLMSAIQYYENTKQSGAQILKTLEKHNLIIPWDIPMNEASKIEPLVGLYQISEDNLNNLSDEDFIDIRNSGSLPLIYAQLLSMSHLKNLFKVLDLRVNKDLAVTEQQEVGTFSFAGL